MLYTLTNKIKQYRIERVNRKELEKEYAKMFQKHVEVSSKCSDMLVSCRKMKLFEGTVDDVEAKYNEFVKLELGGMGQLGCVWSIGKPVISQNDNGVVLAVEYVTNELRDGFDEKEYRLAVVERDEYHDKLIEFCTNNNVGIYQS